MQGEYIKKRPNKMGEILYKYKNSVPIPPLQQIDDVLTVTSCGDPNAVVLNSMINETTLKRN